MEKGQKVGFEDFDLLKLIGRSTFGKVYKFNFYY